MHCRRRRGKPPCAFEGRTTELSSVVDELFIKARAISLPGDPNLGAEPKVLTLIPEMDAPLLELGVADRYPRSHVHVRGFVRGHAHDRERSDLTR